MPFGTKEFCVWHVPRTGGNWLHRAMRQSGIDAQQLGPNLHATRLGYLPSHRYNAVIVRDPIAWYSSCSRWFKQYGLSGPITLWFPGIEQADLLDFDRFLLRHVGCYSRMMDEFAPPFCVRLRTENIAEDACAWLTAIGTSFDDIQLLEHPPENVSESSPHELHTDLCDMIRRTEAL